MKTEQKFKNLKLPVEVHMEIKTRSAKTNQTMISYIKQCLANCKSDVGVKQ